VVSVFGDFSVVGFDIDVGNRVGAADENISAVKQNHL